MQLLDLIEEYTGKRSKVKYAPWRHGDQRVYISDITKLQKYTNWNPQVTIREGVKKLVDWTEKNIEKIKKVSPDVLRNL